MGGLLMAQADMRPSGRQRRRQRIPVEQIKQRMFGSAQQMVYDQGLQISLEELSFEKVIEAAGVSRSSAYRLWPYKDDFVDDLLCYLAGPTMLGSAALDKDTIELVRSIVVNSGVSQHDPQEQHEVLLRAVKEGVAQSFRAMTESREWYIYVALNASVRSAGDDESRLRIAAALLESQMNLVDKFAELYRQMLLATGRRLRDEAYTIRHVAVAGAAIVEGLALRQILTNAVYGAKRPPSMPDHDWSLASLVNDELPGPSAEGGMSEGWSLPAVAFMGIVDAFSEALPVSERSGPGPGRLSRSDSMSHLLPLWPRQTRSV
jgi:AcrR family transcriptional regulator